MDRYIRAGVVALAATVVVGTAGVAVARNGSDDSPDPARSSATTAVPAPSSTHDVNDDKGGLRDRDDRVEPGDDRDDDARRHGADDPADHDVNDDKGGLRDRDDRVEPGDDRDDDGHHGRHHGSDDSGRDDDNSGPGSDDSGHHDSGSGSDDD
ncbi:hypothetical protein ASC61_18905 [Aeromicrobium sp. Root344]|uniref:hypothetical protein n=1 Tax=Aeromicrobium sp. Root344 TaxID=1736521 RepID=UPI0006F53920|nr:hypothetical protein [Aeromicrobium sp. Root344]KQV76901.1 hypothetical protein ASC61_18905 [Aeromicrobium sp. Root344]